MTNAAPMTNSGSLPTSSPKVLVASDLDRTLIYSSAALALTMPDARAPRLLSVEVHESKPLSYMTETAAGLLAELGDVADFVPTTTRTRKQYQRIQLPGPAPKYAICANGGHLLVDGATDLDWHASVTERLARECAPLDEVREHMEATSDPSWVRKHRLAEDLFVYLVVERELLPEDWVKELAVWAENAAGRSPSRAARSTPYRSRSPRAPPCGRSPAAPERPSPSRPGTPSSTPTSSWPRTAAGARATANWPTSGGRLPGSPPSRNGASPRGSGSCGSSWGRFGRGGLSGGWPARWPCWRAQAAAFSLSSVSCFARRRPPGPGLNIRTPAKRSTASTAPTSTTFEYVDT